MSLRVNKSLAFTVLLKTVSNPLQFRFMSLSSTKKLQINTKYEQKIYLQLFD